MYVLARVCVSVRVYPCLQICVFLSLAEELRWYLTRLIEACASGYCLVSVSETSEGVLSVKFF